MAYNNNIPLPGDQISVSQADLLNNFVALQTLIDINHVDFASGDQGKHKWVTFPRQGAIPATAATDVLLFSDLSALSGVSELFYRRQASGTVIEFTSALTNENGWTRLPSGILLKWGTGVANGATVVAFPVAGTVPVFTAVYNAQVTMVSGAGNTDHNLFINLNSYTTTQLNVFGSARTTTTVAAVPFQYLVIGI